MTAYKKNDWKFVRKKTINIHIFFAIAGPFFATLFLTEFDFFNPPLDSPLMVFTSVVMYILILFCIQVPFYTYFFVYREMLKDVYVEKYKFKDEELVWITPLGVKHKIKLDDIFCILYPNKDKKWQGTPICAVYYDKNKHFLFWKRYSAIYFDTLNGYQVKDEYVKRYNVSDADTPPAVISDTDKDTRPAKSYFRKGKIEEYKKEFWSTHNWEAFS